VGQKFAFSPLYPPESRLKTVQGVTIAPSVWSLVSKN